MRPQNDKEPFYAAFLFLIWPFLALISAFVNFRKSWAKNVAWAFVAFFGFTFAIVEGSTSDIVRYISNFQNLHRENLAMADMLTRFIDSSQIDILNTSIIYILSVFTDHQAALTLVYAIIFGYFFSRNVWYVLEKLQGRLQLITIILLVAFLFIIPIWYINGFRMWTATHIFFYGVLPYLFEGKRNRLIVAFMAPLAHFSFVIPAVLLVGYLILGNRVVFYFGFFVVTFFIAEINLTVINQYVEAFTPERFQERTEPYRRAGPDNGLDSIMPDEEGRSVNWYIVWYRKALNWFIVGGLFMIFLKGREKIKDSPGMMSLLSFTLLFYGFANFVSHLPSLWRFLTVAQLISMPLIILYAQNSMNDKFFNRYTWIALPALALFIVVSIRRSFFFMSSTSILGNPVIALFSAGDNIPLEQFIRMLL